MKDEFENEITTSSIQAEKIAPEEFKEKVQKEVLKVENLSIKASATSIEFGDSVTLQAVIKANEKPISIIWYDANGNQI
jgi:hypothetical protein